MLQQMAFYYCLPPSRFSDLPMALQCPVHVASHISKESYIESSSVFCVCTMSLTRNVKYENSHGTSFKGRSQQQQWWFLGKIHLRFLSIVDRDVGALERGKWSLSVYNFFTGRVNLFKYGGGRLFPPHRLVPTMIFDNSISAPLNKERRRRHSPPQCKRILDILILLRPKKRRGFMVN